MHAWFANSDVQYTAYDIDGVRNLFKTSDTMFILGGGESINDVTKQQWEHVAKHDSMGMNFWPVHRFVPSYWYTNVPRDPVHAEKMLDSIRGNVNNNYDETVIFLSHNRVVRRGFHPRVMREWFPPRAKVCYYTYIQPAERLTEDQLGRTLYYRGGLSLCLDIVFRLGYKKIVLLGVDLRNRVHFYDHYPSMKWQFQTGYSVPVEEKEDLPHGTMIEKGEKKPLNEYILAVHNLFMKQGIRLFAGSPGSILAADLPAYRFPGRLPERER
jgi:hypothetical protein